MNNENEHIYDDCIGNPPFAEAMKTLGGAECKLTEGQRGFFEGKQRILDEITPATENEQKLKNLAQFLLNQFKELQVADNRRNAERDAEKERNNAHEKKYDANCLKLGKAMGAMVACYRAIDRNFGDEIRSQIAHNLETEKQGKIKKAMEEINRLSNGK